MAYAVKGPTGCPGYHSWGYCKRWRPRPADPDDTTAASSEHWQLPLLLPLPSCAQASEHGAGLGGSHSMPPVPPSYGIPSFVSDACKRGTHHVHVYLYARSVSRAAAPLVNAGWVSSTAPPGQSATSSTGVRQVSIICHVWSAHTHTYISDRMFLTGLSRSGSHELSSECGGAVCPTILGRQRDPNRSAQTKPPTQRSIIGHICVA